MSPRSGRRPGESGTREAILREARVSFAREGYRRTTVRGVAGAAGVDPALVHHFFGSKDGLFVAAMELPVDPRAVLPALLAEGLDGLGERLALAFLGVWDASPQQAPLLNLLRSAVEHEAAAHMLRDFLTSVVLATLREALPGPDAPLRASLVAAHMLGVAVARYVLHLEPLASADAATVARQVGPALQRYLTPG
ncbi:MAG: TetR family transcriptional regulator [Actinomycetota bacterium]|nr:TetR family transcriptional regulator [Actinomycetota bacterium]